MPKPLESPDFLNIQPTEPEKRPESIEPLGYIFDDAPADRGIETHPTNKLSPGETHVLLLTKKNEKTGRPSYSFIADKNDAEINYLRGPYEELKKYVTEKGLIAEEPEKRGGEIYS